MTSRAHLVGLLEIFMRDHVATQFSTLFVLTECSKCVSRSLCQAEHNFPLVSRGYVQWHLIVPAGCHVVMFSGA